MTIQIEIETRNTIRIEVSKYTKCSRQICENRTS